MLPYQTIVFLRKDVCQWCVAEQHSPQLGLSVSCMMRWGSWTILSYPVDERSKFEKTCDLTYTNRMDCQRNALRLHAQLQYVASTVLEFISLNTCLLCSAESTLDENKYSVLTLDEFLIGANMANL